MVMGAVMSSFFMLLRASADDLAKVTVRKRIAVQGSHSTFHTPLQLCLSNCVSPIAASKCLLTATMLVDSGESVSIDVAILSR